MKLGKYELLETVFSATTTFKKGTIVAGRRRTDYVDIWLPGSETGIDKVGFKRLKVIEETELPVPASSDSYSNAQF